MYWLFCDVLCIFCVYMCTELLPPGGYPTAVKYIISYQYKNMIRKQYNIVGSDKCNTENIYLNINLFVTTKTNLYDNKLGIWEAGN